MEKPIVPEANPGELITMHVCDCSINASNVCGVDLNNRYRVVELTTIKIKACQIPHVGEDILIKGMLLNVVHICRRYHPDCFSVQVDTKPVISPLA